MKDRDLPTLPLFDVVVKVRPLRFVSEMDPEDAEDQLLVEGGSVPYVVAAQDAEAAEELALDEFHGTVPISVLDDFDISATVTGISAHARLERGITEDCSTPRVLR